MSFTDDYLAQKKKKKKYDTGDSFTDEYLNLTGYEISPETDYVAPVKPSSKTEDIAPVKEEKENKWFQSGLFEDGYQFGDIFKTIRSTDQDLATNITAGILGIGEKVVDAGATAVGAVGSLFGADEFADKTKDFVKKDLYDEEKLAENISGSVFTRILRLAGAKTPDYEAESVLGEKTDSLAQSGGQLLGTMALQAVGVPWWVTSGTTSFGSEAESAFKEDASYGEAVVSGLVTAGAEMLSEKLFGGSGLGEKGLIKLDVLTKGISNKAIKLLADYGFDMGAEGIEEIFSEFVSTLGTQLTYEREETLSELLNDEEAFRAYSSQVLDSLFGKEARQKYKDAFIGGVALGGLANAGKVKTTIETGRDYRTELTDSEQSVVDREFKDRLAEKEKAGETLSKKEQAELYDKVIRDMERGYLDTGKIESVVGGDVYRQYEAAKAQEDAILKEFKELGNKKDATLAEQTRYEQLKETVRDIKANSRSEFLKSMMKENIYRKGDRLYESYRERSRRGEAFKVNIANYDEKEKETVQKAIDSGILNNSNRTHEFVDTIAKISADKGVSFDFTNNDKLRESGFAIDGATVNGFVTKDGVTVNIDSQKALNTVVGHEITHVLEGTELYSELQSAIIEYAKTKKDYQGRYDSIKELYKGIEGADIDAELTADLVGDYLFTDEDFINNLSVKNRNVFQKIYDEIKYLLKVVTAGSKEAKELERVKRAFDKAYKEGGKPKFEGKNSTKYGLSIDNSQNLVYNGERGETYARTDEFRNLQAESQRMSDEDTKLYHSGSKRIDDEVRGRLSRAFGLEIRSADSERIPNIRTLLNPKTNKNVNIVEGVDGPLFHDIFEISRNYLRNGELVDLHTVETTEDGIGYNDCYNYLSEDGLSGFSITPDGDLISVFNLNTERGFLKTIAPIVKERAKTLDCYASQNQNLMVMYETIFGFKTASIMDYNMEYDHDNIAENHGMPKVAFMVNTESDVEVKNFSKDEYGEAVEYRNSFVNQATSDGVASFMPKNDGDVRNSLSKEGDAPKRYGNYNVSGEDVKLEAPVREATPENATTTPEAKAPEAPPDIMPEGYAPVIEKTPEKAYEAIRPQKPGAEPKQSEPRMKRVDSKNTAPDGMEERRWYETSTGSEAVDGIITPDDIPDDVRYYQVKSNEKTLATANARLAKDGYAKSREYFEGRMSERKLSVEDIALGERLIQEAAKAGDAKAVRDLIIDVSIIGTELGQRVQALSMIRRLTPEGQLKALYRTVERGKAKGDKAFDGVEVTEEMTKTILETMNEDGTFDQAELNAAVEDVKQKIADQMDVGAMDYINAWRYLSMLGNPKTHIRNLVSNVAMMGTRAVKNALARTIEDIAPIKNRTKTWERASDAVKEFAKQTTKDMDADIRGDAKYSEEGSIKAKRQIFKTRLGNMMANANNKALEFEDTLFSKHVFRSTLSEYLTANGIKTAEDIKNNPELVEKAKDYALAEAERATFRQDSYLAKKIHEIEKKNPVYGMAVGSIMPFKKTPINVAKTGLAYSPLGLARNIYDAVQVGKGNMDASEAIDHLAQTLTGSSLALIGYALAESGILNGAGDDDKEGKYDYQLGEQSYSFNFGGDSFSLSWLSPIAMPLFVGANAFEQLVEGKEWNANVVIDTLAQTLDPLSEMSFISSLDDVLSSYDSGIAKIWGAGESMVQNYATQFIPTLSSQVGQMIDDTKRSTKAAKDSGFRFGEELVNKIKYKIPGLRETLEPTTDIWGNEVAQTEGFFASFFSPANKREGIGTAVDDEIKELYRQTGKNEVIPAIPDNYINYDGAKYEMSAKDFTEYKELYGQTAYELMEKLFDTDTYKAATDEEKAELVGRVYDYARDEAKLKYFTKFGVDYTNSGAEGEEVYKENPIKGAIEADLPVDEYVFSKENPEKYNFFKQNGVSYDDYKNGSEEFKEAYSWAFKNPEKFELSKAVASDVVEYRRYSGELYDIKADKDEDGKSITGSRKEKVLDYINGLDLDYGAKLILFKNEYNADDTYNYEIINYLNEREDISYEQMETILKELGFTVDKEGNIYWD